MYNYAPTIISQYANSPIITGLIDFWAQNLDVGAQIDQFYSLIWDLGTAQGYGLDVWGRILNVGRVLTVANEPILGFEEALPGVGVFNEGTFYPGGSTTSNYALSDTAYRVLLFAKAAANICDSAVPSINRVLMLLFGNRGDCYCTDGQNMSMTYTFTFALTAVERAIVLQSGALPKPAGVSVTVVEP